ncbi:MAG TPA: adenylate/guanylate cyclase domain-containing protein [Mycobacterium sp.]|nr:adenylate/guanylate cyclase domain-containing protein [Mycobacterium sp.]
MTTNIEAEATFAFIDLAGFTALTETHGDMAAVALLDRFEAMVDAALGPSDRLVKTIGDAVMVAYGSPVDAVCALDAILAGAAREPGFPVPRAGLHHGSAIMRGDDYIGAAVNLAARVTAQAHGGQVLATTLVAQHARDSGYGVIELGSFQLRNVTDPVELFALELGPVGDQMTIDPVCRMQVARDEAAGRLRHNDHAYWFCSLECASQFAANPSDYVVSG